MSGKKISESELRRKFAELLPEPLFDMTIKKNGEPTKRAAKAKTVRKADCPECRQSIGIIKVTRDMRTVEMFRVHDKRTIKGHRFRCSGSETEAPNGQ